MSEKVSVLFVLPAGSAEEAAVQETLQGFASQTYPSSLIEVIQVQYVPSDPVAHTSALNAALEGATGAFVIHVEPGVIWDGNKVEMQVQRLQADPAAGASVHRMTVRDCDGKARVLDLAEIRAYGPRIGCLLKSPWGTGAAMFRREVVAQLGAYRNADEVLWEYAVRLVCAGFPLDLLDMDLAVWKIDPASRMGQEGRRPLAPSQIRHRFLKSYLDRETPERLFEDRGPISEPGGRLVLAGLHQKNDDLIASHALCREVCSRSDCPEANYWHGIAHRRETDFAGAGARFRKVKGMPALSEMKQQVAALLNRVLQIPDYGNARESALAFLRHLHARDTWDALYFLDLCESCATSGTAEDRRLLEEIQEVEFDVLFEQTYRLAIES